MTRGKNSPLKTKRQAAIINRPLKSNCNIENMHANFVKDTLTIHYTFEPEELAAILTIAKIHLKRFEDMPWGNPTPENPRRWHEELLTYEEICRQLQIDFDDVDIKFKENLGHVNNKQVSVAFTQQRIFPLISHLDILLSTTDKRKMPKDAFNDVRAFKRKILGGLSTAPIHPKSQLVNTKHADMVPYINGPDMAVILKSVWQYEDKLSRYYNSATDFNHWNDSMPGNMGYCGLYDLRKEKEVAGGVLLLSIYLGDKGLLPVYSSFGDKRMAGGNLGRAKEALEFAINDPSCKFKAEAQRVYEDVIKPCFVSRPTDDESNFKPKDITIGP